MSYQNATMNAANFMFGLDAANFLIRSGQAREASGFLNDALTSIVTTCSEAEISDYLNALRSHDLLVACMEDPYTKRAFEKPRGYAGDAMMLDYIYKPTGVSLTLGGQTTHQITTKGPMGLSIIFRRDFLRSVINHALAVKSDARILSVASGHARELEGSYLETERHSATFFGLDQDSESCDHVESSYPHSWMRVQRDNVRKLFSPKYDLGAFDLIYSAGLYDYLSDDVTRKLTSALIDRLSTGGRLILGNFVPDCIGRGYMELVMDWRLVWRKPEELFGLFDPSLQPRVQVFKDPHFNVAYASYVHHE